MSMPGHLLVSIRFLLVSREFFSPGQPKENTNLPEPLFRKHDHWHDIKEESSVIKTQTQLSGENDDFDQGSEAMSGCWKINNYAALYISTSIYIM